MQRIFISYRREDTSGYAGRIHDRLAAAFGDEKVFMDVDSVPLGVNFVKALSQEVAESDALVVLIGPSWLDAEDSDGKRRVDDPGDFVRIEIEAALNLEIPVIPVLLDGASMPRAGSLPECLSALAYHNGLHARHSSFNDDVRKLVAGLRRLSTIHDENLVGDEKGADVPEPPSHELRSSPKLVQEDSSNAVQAADPQELTDGRNSTEVSDAERAEKFNEKTEDGKNFRFLSIPSTFPQNLYYRFLATLVAVIFTRIFYVGMIYDYNYSSTKFQIYIVAYSPIILIIPLLVFFTYSKNLAKLAVLHAVILFSGISITADNDIPGVMALRSLFTRELFYPGPICHAEDYLCETMGAGFLIGLVGCVAVTGLALARELRRPNC